MLDWVAKFAFVALGDFTRGFRLELFILSLPLAVNPENNTSCTIIVKSINSSYNCEFELGFKHARINSIKLLLIICRFAAGFSDKY